MMNTLPWWTAAIGCAVLASAPCGAAEPASAAIHLTVDVRSSLPSGSAVQGLRHYAASASAELAPRWRSFASVSGQRNGEIIGRPGFTDLQARLQTGLAWDDSNGATLSIALQRGLTRDEPARALAVGWTMKY